jgi:hypothetical protein
MYNHLYEIKETKIIFDNGIIINFDYPIGGVADYGDVIVVRLEIPYQIRDIIFNENVFGVSVSGKILWQIKPQYPKTKKVYYGSLDKEDQYAVVANWLGLVLYLDPYTGNIVKREEQLR